MTDAQPSGRPRSPTRRVMVETVDRITPLVTRIVMKGEELAGFGPPRPAAHIKLHMQPEGTPWSPLDTSAPRPPRRTYTPRYFDPAGLRLEVEFVLHGHGIAASWAQTAAPGHTMFVSGPGGGYDKPADATSIVIVADDTALPAAAMILEALPAGTKATILAEVAASSEERILARNGSFAPTWLARDKTNAVPGTLLEKAVRDGALTGDGVCWWVACEASAMRRIKQHLLRDRGVAPAHVHTRGYWKLGETAYPDHDYGAD